MRASLFSAWRTEHFRGRHGRTDEGKARPNHGRCQPQFHRMGRRQGAGSAGRGDRAHLSGRSLRAPRQAARGRDRGAVGHPLRRRGRDLAGRGVQDAEGRMGNDRLRPPCHRLFRQERAQGPLCRHHARKLLAYDDHLLLLLHGSREAGGGNHDERRRDGHHDLWRRDARHAELQCHGGRQGRTGSLGALSRRRLRAAQYSRQHGLGRPCAHARRCRCGRCPADVQLPAPATRRCAATRRSTRSAARFSI